MPEKFEEYLEAARWAAQRTIPDDQFERWRENSVYYWNCASDLHSAALVLWHAHKSPEMRLDPEKLGLGSGFQLEVSLPPVFAQLCGLSLEVLLKAIARILGRPHLPHHRLTELASNVGIPLDTDQRAMLDALSEYIYWLGRYPVPHAPEDWERTIEKLDALRSRTTGPGQLVLMQSNPRREIGLLTYTALWDYFAGYYGRATIAVPEL